MIRLKHILFVCTFAFSFGVTAAPALKIARYVPGKTVRMNYPNSLTTLLVELNKGTTLKVDPQPVILQSFENKDLFQYPVIYANYADRKDWTFTDLEMKNLKKYFERGGFLYIDAGINAEFLRKKQGAGQHHSFANWSISPDLGEQFKRIYPSKQFQPLKTTHEIFRLFKQGLPEASSLPETVREFVVNEKWPDGTYSTVALRVNGRIAVMATPIIAMGWGRNALGQWRSTISFRIRESAEGLSGSLETAAYGGERYPAVRRDGRDDFIYCQEPTRPAWVEEADGIWRVFRYYNSTEISEYAHIFYTQLGVNIFLYAMTH